MAITIITGTPGVGKSTLARRLADDSALGVHLETDEFFRFVAHRVGPSLREAHEQNLTVARAYARAAREYERGGYHVYMDGVIGPWLVSVIAPVLDSFEYVLLSAPLDVALARARERSAQGSATPEVIRTMHAQFAAILPGHRQHIIETANRSIEEIVADYREGSAFGRFAWTSAAGGGPS